MIVVFWELLFGMVLMSLNWERRCKKRKLEMGEKSL
jgi:hypothetical protein